MQSSPNRVYALNMFATGFEQEVFVMSDCSPCGVASTVSATQSQFKLSHVTVTAA